MYIHNKKTESNLNKSNYTYIGRGSALGNPYAIGIDGDRDEVIDRYEQWLSYEISKKNPVVLTALRKLNSESHLVCYCSPAPCHGQVIEKLWRAKIAGKTIVNPRTSIYAGIGARKTPEKVLGYMTDLADRLSDLNYTLRSGGAHGADNAFALAGGAQEIYLPWPGYNDIESAYSVTPSIDAIRIAKQLHPNWERLSQGVQKLMARNAHQILGEYLNDPVDFVVCWTPDGVEHGKDRTQKTGGTGLAIELASLFSIPVYNLYNPDAVQRLTDRVTSYPGYPSPTLDGPAP